MKVLLDRELCESNAICVGHCPDAFCIGEDETLTLLMEEPPEAYRAGVEEAVARCPRQALRIEG